MKSENKRSALKRGAFLCILLSGILPSAAQNLKIYKATEQTLHHGASPTASVNYQLHFKKRKKASLTIDSVKTIADKKKMSFHLLKKNPAGDYEFYTGHEIKREETGFFLIGFGFMKNIGDGRENPDESEGAGEYESPAEPPPDTGRGFIIYYTAKGKKKESPVKTFSRLEDIAAP